MRSVVGAARYFKSNRKVQPRCVISLTLFYLRSHTAETPDSLSNLFVFIQTFILISSVYNSTLCLVVKSHLLFIFSSKLGVVETVFDLVWFLACWLQSLFCIVLPEAWGFHTISHLCRRPLDIFSNTFL